MIPCAHDDCGGLTGSDNPHIHTAVKPWRLPLTMGTTQEQALGTERFQQKQDIFQCRTAIYETIKT